MKRQRGHPLIHFEGLYSQQQQRYCWLPASDALHSHYQKVRMLVRTEGVASGVTRRPSLTTPWPSGSSSLPAPLHSEPQVWESCRSVYWDWAHSSASWVVAVLWSSLSGAERIPDEEWRLHLSMGVRTSVYGVLLGITMVEQLAVIVSSNGMTSLASTE